MSVCKPGEPATSSKNAAADRAKKQERTPPTEAQALLQQVKELGMSDPPRRILLCRDALRRVDRIRDPELWGELQVHLTRIVFIVDPVVAVSET